MDKVLPSLESLSTFSKQNPNITLHGIHACRKQGRAGRLNEHLFATLSEAREIIDGAAKPGMLRISWSLRWRRRRLVMANALP
jgi:hypothetical protein